MISSHTVVMRAARNWGVAASFLTLTAPLALAAQTGAAVGSDYREDGLWWTAGFGAAGARLTCDLCQTSRDLGPAVDLVVGAVAGPGLRVGVDVGAWTHDDHGVRESVYRAGLLAFAHPRPGSGLHLIGGLGWSGYRAGSFGYDAVRLTVGAGWDLPIVGGWVMGNQVTLDAASFGSLANQGTTVVSGVGLSLLRFGVYVGRR
jgi:hypothetical protein